MVWYRPARLAPTSFILVDGSLNNPTDGLVVDGLWAMRLSKAEGQVGALSGTSTAAKLRPHFRLLNEVVLDPSCPPSEMCQHLGEGPPYHDWHVVLECHITSPGRYVATSFSLRYRINDDPAVRTQVFRKTIELISE